ncbi:DUF4240 domain-containing protein [Streptomyces sp. NPDC048462]|uniref:DUF4240 domain-containing protein n=1 Tax=Streptomyces sp. NPDC048462 TaxID=3365555 RepID=UPI00372076E0
MMSWRDFWTLIEVLEGRADQGRCTRLVEVLAQRSAAEITGFGERLAEALYRLDQEKFGLLPVADMSRPGGPFPQSGDHFLYSRCALVAAGREAYESVFEESARFSPFTATTMEGESLLYVTQQAYEQATGEEWDRATRHSFESYANRDGWPGRP